MTANFNNIKTTTNIDLSGWYTVTSVSEVDISVDVSAALDRWSLIGSSPVSLTAADTATIGPYDTQNAVYTDWFTVKSIKTDRVLCFGV